MLVFGLGTGRSGSYSLASFLDAQIDSEVSHENFWCPWEYDDFSMNATLQTMYHRNKGLVGDVACYLLPYVEKIIEKDSDVKFICIKRGKEETVNSWLKHSGKINHWTKNSNDINGLTFVFPKYDLPKKEALEKYWDDYYAWSGYLEQEFPDNMRVLDIDALSSQKGQDSILGFLGVEDRVYGDFHTNKSGEDLIEKKEMGYKSGPCSICKEGQAEYYIINKTLGLTDYACKECYDAN